MKYPSMPIVGTLPAERERQLTLTKEISPDMRPVVVTAHAGDVVVVGYTTRTVSLKNKTSLPVPFVLTFVPRGVVELGTLPWRDMFRAGREIWTRLARALRGR